MNILYYEHMESNEGSYNGQLGSLVKQLRHYRNVPADQTKVLIPAIQATAAFLQKTDALIAKEERDYIGEIMAALDAETDKESDLMEELPFACGAIATHLFSKPFSLDDYSFEYTNTKAVQWLELFGYKEEGRDIVELQPIAEAFRATCYRHGVIFIDSTPKPVQV